MIILKLKLTKILRSWFKRYFYPFFLASGLLLSVLALVPYYLYYSAPRYSFQPSFGGFGVARNSTHNITPDHLRILIGVEANELFFNYWFSCSENGTYNFLFWFPFEIVSTIGSTEGINFNETSKGSAVWLRYKVDDVGHHGTYYDIWGDFLIENTFQSGSSGSYMFILPFGRGIPSALVSDLQKNLGVAFQSPDSDVELGLSLPARYRITQTFPELQEGPEPWITPTNRTLTTVGWRFDNLHDSVTIYCEDSEILRIQSFLPLAGIFIGFGMSITARAVYDWVKKWAGV